MPTKHFPYLYCPQTGTGPRGGATKRRDKWSCTCAKKHRPRHRGAWSKCTCIDTNTGRERTVWNSLGYRKHYNVEYKKWVRDVRNRRRICRRPGKRDFPRQGTGLIRPPNVRPMIRLRIKMLERRRGHG